MPLDALTDLLFFRPAIKPEDVVSALIPDYPEGDGTKCQRSVLRVIDGADNQKKKTKKGILVDLLMEAVAKSFSRTFFGTQQHMNTCQGLTSSL